MPVKKNQPAAIEVAKRNRDREEDGTTILSTGVRVRLIPVNPATVAEVVAEVKDPPVPMWFNKEKGRDEPNPMDPSYESAKATADQQRGLATMDTLALMGVELAEGLPEDDGWLVKLKLLHRRGHLNLDDFDLEDEIDLKYLYVKHVAIGPDDWNMLFRQLNVGEEGVNAAGGFFQSSEVGGPN
jgi:hypothetical protein